MLEGHRFPRLRSRIPRQILGVCVQESVTVEASDFLSVLHDVFHERNKDSVLVFLVNFEDEGPFFIRHVSPGMAMVLFGDDTVLPEDLGALESLWEALIVCSTEGERGRIHGTTDMQALGLKRSGAAQMKFDGTVKLVVGDTVEFWDVDESVFGDVICNASKEPGEHHASSHG